MGEFLLLPEGESLKATEGGGKKKPDLGRVFYRGKLRSWVARERVQLQERHREGMRALVCH